MNNRKEYMKKWQENNRDKTRESARRWYNKNIEKIKDKRQTNEYKEKHREYNKKYRQNQKQELEKYKNIVNELETYLQRKYDEYIDMESDDAFTISLVLDTLRELKGE